MKALTLQTPAMHFHSMSFDSPRRRAKRALFGLAVMGLGALALIDNLHLFDIALLHTFWPLIFVFFGLGRLLWPRHPGGALVGVALIGLGGLMTAHNLGQITFNLHQWWPVFIVLAGLSIVLRGLFPGRCRSRHFEVSSLEHDDHVNVDASFSGVKLRNDSRSFKGGRVLFAFGGLELDLREAVMDAPEATLDISARFAGIELRVPRDWQVVVQMQSRMGAVEDKSLPPPSPSHRLILRGENVFGALQVKN